MLEHLIGPDLDPKVCETAPTDAVSVDAATPGQIVAAQNSTVDWLEQLGLTQEHCAPKAAAAIVARETFQKLAVDAIDNQTQVHALLEIKAPEAIRHLTAMLTAYDWEFVEQAKKIRSFVVTRLMEESSMGSGGKAGDRIKALTALGKVTEVGLFTEKVEVTKVNDMTNEEIDTKIRERLAKLRGVMDALPHAPTVIDDATPKHADGQ